MPFTKPTDEQLNNRFMHHAPFGTQADRYGCIRAAALEFAKVVRDLTPCSAEQTRAINAIDEAMMLANAAIARNEPRPAPEHFEGSGGITCLCALCIQPSDADYSDSDFRNAPTP